MPTLTQLEYIIAVDKHRHFGRAARACHISQPTLSMQIHKVEDDLGITIFDRLKKPIVPTSRGREFIEQAKVLLREHEKLLEVSRSGKTELSGEFRLGVIPTIAPYLVPRFIASFSKRYPKVTLKIEELRTSSIIEALRQDQIDAGILATPLHETGLKERPLYYEPFHLYVQKDHPLAKRTKIREEDLDGSEMWLLQDGHCFRTQVVRFCSLTAPGARESGAIRNVRFEGGSLETLRQLIRNSRGYTLVPHLFATELPADERRASLRPFEAPVPTREVSLVFRADQWRSGHLEALEKVVVQSVPEELRAAFHEARKQKQLVLKVT